MTRISKTIATVMIGTGFALNAFQGSSANNSSQSAKETFNLQKFGQAGAGGDDTPIFRRAFAAAGRKGGTIRVPALKSAYHVSPLYIPSNITLMLDPGVVIQALPGYSDGQKLINIADAANVRIIGSGSLLKMNRAEYKAGEYRHCVYIIGSTDVLIKNVTCADAGGNGVYIGASENKPYSENISLEEVKVENSLTPALNLVSGKNILIRRCRFAHSKGSGPAAGINVEPNRPAARLENIRLEDNITEANTGDGVRLMLSRLNNNSSPISITAVRHYDKAAGGSSFNGSYDPPGGRSVHGYVLFENCRSETAQQYGAVFSFWSSAGPRATLRGLTVINPNQSGSTIDNAAVAVKRGGGGAGTIGNVEFTGTTIRDTRPSPKLDYYFTFIDYSKIGIRDVVFSNPVQLTGAVHKSPLGLFQGQGVEKLEKSDSHTLLTLWRKAEGPAQSPGARASAGSNGR